MTELLVALGLIAGAVAAHETGFRLGSLTRSADEPFDRQVALVRTSTSSLGPLSPMRRRDLDAFSCYGIDPIGAAPVNRKHQGNDIAAVVHDTDLKVRVGRRNRNQQPFVRQRMHVEHQISNARGAPTALMCINPHRIEVPRGNRLLSDTASKPRLDKMHRAVSEPGLLMSPSGP